MIAGLVSRNDFSRSDSVVSHADRESWSETEKAGVGGHARYDRFAAHGMSRTERALNTLGTSSTLRLCCDQVPNVMRLATSRAAERDSEIQGKAQF